MSLLPACRQPAFDQSWINQRRKMPCADNVRNRRLLVTELRPGQQHALTTASFFLGWEPGRTLRHRYWNTDAPKDPMQCSRETSSSKQTCSVALGNMLGEKEIRRPAE